MPFQPTNLGYDSTATAHKASPGPNGALINTNATAQDNKSGSDEIDLWVYEVNTSFAMVGSIGQSYRTRSYFPHNFVQPAITVMCQFPNQHLYADATEWIHDQQVTFQSAINLHIIPHATGVKGLAEPIVAQGYVKSIARVHERFVYAPLMQFDFLVEQQYSPSGWADPASAAPLKLNDWEDIISKQKPGFVRPSGNVVTVNVPPQTGAKKGRKSHPVTAPGFNP